MIITMKARKGMINKHYELECYSKERGRKRERFEHPEIAQKEYDKAIKCGKYVRVILSKEGLNPHVHFVIATWKSESLKEAQKEINFI